MPISTENRFGYQAWRPGVRPHEPAITEANCGDHPNPQTLQSLLLNQARHGIIPEKQSPAPVLTSQELVLQKLRQQLSKMNDGTPHR